MGRIRLNTEKITKLGLIALAISLFVLMLRGCAIARGGYEGDSDAPTADGDDAMADSVSTEAWLDQRRWAALEEALKAQSVAARTYTARKMASLGGKPCGRGGADVCTDSTCCQAYRTLEELSEKWGGSADMYFDKLSGAVSATRGVILTYDGKRRILKAYQARARKAFRVTAQRYPSPASSLQTP